MAQRTGRELLREPPARVVHDVKYTAHDEARASLFEYIEAFYNRQRRHSTLGYLSPEEYEREQRPTTKQT